MAGQPVLAGATFAAGILAQALGTYKQMYEVSKKRLGGCMEIDYPSTRREEIYAYMTTPPVLNRWPVGSNMEAGTFKGVRYTCLNHRFAQSVSWNASDAQDDQLNSLLLTARGIGANAAQLDERLFFQILNGTTDTDLLPSATPNAPDGAALYSATDGASAIRFGVSGGNIVTGNIDSAIQCRTAYWTALGQFRNMQDTQGQPLHDESVIDGPKILIYGAANEQVFRESFIQNQVAGVADVGVDPGSLNIAGVSNLIHDSNQVPTLWSTQRISDNNSYLFLENSPIKAIFSQLREPLREQVATMDNSDIARDSGVESVRFWLRKGVSPNLPYQTIQLNI
jgi:hypothetical protein